MSIVVAITVKTEAKLSKVFSSLQHCNQQETGAMESSNVPVTIANRRKKFLYLSIAILLIMTITTTVILIFNKVSHYSIIIISVKDNAWNLRKNVQELSQA